MKKLLALTTFLLIAVSSFAFEYNGLEFWFNIDDGSTVCVKGLADESLTKIVIPEKVPDPDKRGYIYK